MGTEFGRYTLLRRLAAGGMSEIMLASDNDANWDHYVVVKRILPEYAARPPMVAMFREEARIASLLAHPNIVRNSPSQQHNGVWFIVQEYVDGANLTRLMTYIRSLTARIPIRLAVYIAASVADALEHAHGCIDPKSGRPLRIVHRDITPRNVMVSRGGAVKLTDFGIAKAEGHKSKSMHGVAKGTVAYMSPEQAHVRQLDCRSDLFSLGVVLHEMLTGELLFGGEADFVVMQRIACEPTAAPSTKNAEVGAELDAVCGRLLEKDPKDRYQTAGELADVLLDWLERHGCDHPQDEMRDWLRSLGGKRASG